MDIAKISPHIPLGISVSEGLSLLKTVSNEIEKEIENDEVFYKASNDEFECGFYETDGKVTSAWYNDPSGRDSQEGLNKKITTYLARYGNLDDWRDGVNNGWIQFFYNDKENSAMAYGLHKDVIRFNYVG